MNKRVFKPAVHAFSPSLKMQISKSPYMLDVV